MGLDSKEKPQESSPELFKGVTYYVVGEISNEVTSLLEKHGAKRDSYLSEMVSHVIADNTNSDDYSEAKELFELPIVTSDWVTLSVLCRKQLPKEAFALEGRLFSKVVACPSDLETADILAIWAMIVYHGGKCQLHLDERVTHLITASTDSPKYTASLQQSDTIKIVTPDWLKDAITKEEVQNEAVYHPSLIQYPKSDPPPLPPELEHVFQAIDMSPASPSSEHVALVSGQAEQLSGDERMEVPRPDTPNAKEALARKISSRIYSKVSSEPSTPEKSVPSMFHSIGSLGVAPGVRISSPVPAMGLQPRMESSPNIRNTLRNITNRASTPLNVPLRPSLPIGANKINPVMSMGLPHPTRPPPPDYHFPRIPGPMSTATSTTPTATSQAPTPNTSSAPPPGPQYFGHDPKENVPGNACLLGCVFLIVDYQNIVGTEEIASWKKVIEQHGGQVESSYCNRVTHIMSSNQRSEVFKMALKEGKRLVTAYWLNDCLMQKKMVPPWQALHLPLSFNSEKPGFNQMISVTNFDGEERTRLKQMIYAIGAKYTGYMTHHNSALICKKPGGMKFEKAKEWRIAVVNVQWLSDLVLGHMEALRLPVHVRYLQVGQGREFHMDLNRVSHLLGDSVYEDLKDIFLKTGRGRRKSIPHQHEVTQRILAQLHLLKSEGNGFTWEEVISWFDELFPDQHVTKGCLLYAISTAVNHQDLDAPVDLSSIAEALEKIGLCKAALLDEPDKFTPSNSPVVMSNLVVYDLECFRNKYSLPLSFVSQWIHRLLAVGGYLNTFTDPQIKSKVAQIVKKIKTLKKSKSKKHILDSYLSEFDFEILSTSSSSSSECINCIKDSQLKTEIIYLKEKLSKAESKIVNLNLSVDILKSERHHLKENEKLADKVKELQLQLSNCNERNIDLSNSLYTLKRSKLYKRNTALGKKVVVLQQQNRLLDAHINNINESSCAKETLLNSEILKLKAKVKSEQCMKSRYKKQSLTLCDVINKDIPTTSDLVLDTSTRDHLNNRFSDDVRLTYMSLLGECNVAAQNCTKVVRTVSDLLFKCKFATDDLPCTSTVLKFANEASIITKHQVVEEIKDSFHVTLATDGTSRQKKQYLERHVVLDSGVTLSLGFAEVACEDADTLLEKSIEVLSDLCDVYCETDQQTTKEEIFNDTLSKIKCLMSDRASVMKSFDEKFSAYKKDILGQDASTHFLFCNAHFLLGLVTSAKDAVFSIDNEVGKVGRDLESKFSNFSSASEPSAFRLIRTASSILGPRGDEKSGCREQWLTFLQNKNKKSAFTSFRSNRFNNLFENASAITFHRYDVIEFLTDYCTHSNLLTQSVLADLKDDKLFSIIYALSLFHVFFTGPYWSLMNSYKSYGDFPSYVKTMNEALTKWSDKDFKLDDAFSVFDDFLCNVPYDHVHHSIDQSIVYSTFVGLVTNTIIVFQRQLADFLPGGVFCDVVDAELMSILKSSPLTNLIGERMFGHLDYDMCRRRNATIHFRTVLNMWKINRTGNYLKKQDKSKIKRLLVNARKHAPAWKKKSMERQRDVRAQIQARMVESKRRKEDLAIKKLSIRNDLINDMLCQGGLCTTKGELDSLMEGNNVKSNLQSQIKYRKLVLGENILSSGGNVSQLYVRLCKHLGCDEDLPVTVRRGKKRPRF